MSTVIRCPRCKAETDSSSAKPGSVIKCVHCRGDMRVPDGGAKGGPAGGARGGPGGGRQSTLFRKMTNATVPGQRGRAPSSPMGGGRGASDGPRNMSGVYQGLGIAGGIAVIIVIALLIKGKSTEPEKPTAKKAVAKAPLPPPPPTPPPAPPVDTMKEIQKAGAPPTFEHGAENLVPEGVNPVVASDPAAEKDAIAAMKSHDMKAIYAKPYKYLPFIINSMINDDQVTAVAAFNALYEFCEENNLRFTDGKNLIDLSLINNPKYRAYTYQEWVLTFWPSRSNKLADSPGNATAVEREDWAALVGKMKGGAFHTDENQKIAFQKVKNYGKAAYPKLAALIDHEDLGIAQAANSVLNELTGEKKPRPNEANKADVKRIWLTWIEKNK